MPNLLNEPSSDPASGKGRLGGAVAIVATVSTITAFAISSFQKQPLGDYPLTMIAVGCVLAGTSSAMRCAPPQHCGIAAMAGFPLWAMADLAANAGHSLLPIEFAFYAVYAGLGIFAAVLAEKVRLRFRQGG